MKPALRNASEAFDERVWVRGWISGGEFLELECTAEDIAMTPSVIDATK